MLDGIRLACFGVDFPFDPRKGMKSAETYEDKVVLETNRLEEINTEMNLWLVRAHLIEPELIYLISGAKNAKHNYISK